MAHISCMQVMDTQIIPPWAQEGEVSKASRISLTESRHHEAEVPRAFNSFWTSRQRAGHSLHEVSYRACFKPQLPAYFIDNLTTKGDSVLDCFMGRGTTLLEAALRGRRAWGNDVNPLGRLLIEPRLEPVLIEEVESRLKSIRWTSQGQLSEDLLVFFHEDTLRELYALRRYLGKREKAGTLDPVDRWIRMVALNRLTGHSKGFFSVYTLPPNQAVTVEAQRRINRQRQQVPDYRDVAGLIVKKSKALMRHVEKAAPRVFPGWRDQLLTGPAAAMSAIPDRTIHLVVTSPPFLDTVDYQTDNWLRCWFAGIDSRKLPIKGIRSIEAWEQEMLLVFQELRRVLKPGGHVAFEVGEVRGGTVDLENHVLEIGIASGLRPEVILHHFQKFTKTAHCWGIKNGQGGTNSQRIVVFVKR